MKKTTGSSAFDDIILFRDGTWFFREEAEEHGFVGEVDQTQHEVQIIPFGDPVWEDLIVNNTETEDMW